MRAIFCSLVMLSVCFSETLSWNRNLKIDANERYSRTRFLVAKHNYNKLPKSSIQMTNWSTLSTTTAVTPTAITPSTTSASNSSRISHFRKRRKYLKKERNKLRNTLKSKSVRDNKDARESILKRINEINMELRKYLKKGPKHKRRKHTNKKLKEKVKEDTSSILEVTTARNKNYIFKWNLKNNSSLNKIIKKLNQNPEQDFVSEKNDEFKTEDVDAAFISKDKFQLDATSDVNNSGNKFKGKNAMDYNNDVNLLPSTPRNSNVTTNHTDNSLTTEFYEVLQITPDSATLLTTESFKTSGDKNNALQRSSTNKELQGSTNTISRINYADLMTIQKTTMPPITNVSLDTIVAEFNAISNQIGVLFPGNHKYPKYNVTRTVVYKKYRKTRCSINKGGCEHICHPTGPKRCSCLSGFKLAFNKRKCVDINECAHNNAGCNHFCHNTPGSFYCSCPSGLRLSDDVKSCEDINECLLRNGHGPCQDTCENTYGSYKCSCSALKGTRLGKDKHSCEDVDECVEGRSGCSHGCVNTLGRAFCTCPEGMELGADWKTCNDINECDDEEIQKGCEYGCINTIGSYYCVQNYEIQSDQTVSPVPDHVVCPPLFPPKHGFLECSREKGLSVKLRTRSGRRRVTNRPGMFCQLVCPVGYKNVGVFRLTCGLDGQWLGDNSGKCSGFPPPTIKCPESQQLYLNTGEETTVVEFKPPKTNVDWKYLTSIPRWAKELRASLPHGYHRITFTVTDPHTHITAKCSFDITIKKSR